jgi:hypothetical protein
MKGKAVSAASTIWNWAKNHQILAGAIALGVAGIMAFRGKWVWNWILAPLVRTASNAAFGYAMFGTIGGAIGGAMGAIHGFAMAKAGSYDWKSGFGWLAFAADNSWSLFNSFIASAFATANIGWNEIDDTNSENSGSLYFKSGWFGSFDTTLGNVTVGQSVPTHESVHAWQARILGPTYIPVVVLSYEIATMLPYWLIYGHCSIKGLGDYFMKGVYPNTLHEAIAYKVEGGVC